jgi:hypothetical protein
MAIPIPAKSTGQTSLPTPVAQGATEASSRPPLIEADVRVKMAGSNKALVNGTVRLDHRFVCRMVPYLLRSPRRFKHIQVHFDAATGSYAATGQIKLLGMWWPVSARAKPQGDGSMVAFKFEDLRLQFGKKGISAMFLKGMVANIVADALKESNIVTSAVPKSGVVRMDVNSLLAEIDALPAVATLDTSHTWVAVATSAKGDLTVSFDTPGMAPAINSSPRSDITLEADPKALEAILGQALAPDFELTALNLKENRIQVDGQVDYTPVTDVVNGVKLLAVLLSNGRANPRFEKVMGPLSLDVAMDGTRLVVNPSIKAARKQLLETLKKAQIPVQERPDGLHVDLTKALEDRGIQVKNAHVDAHGLSGSVQIDIDSRLRNSQLRDPEQIAAPKQP